MEKQKRGYYRSLLNNKRGFAGDTITIVVELFATAVILIVMMWLGNTVADSMSPKIKEEELKIAGSQNLSAPLTKMASTFNATFDFVFLGVFMALLLGGLVLSFFVRFHPVFLVFFIIIAVIAVLIAAQVSNAYEAIEDDSHFYNQTLHMPMQHLVMDGLPFIIAAVAFLMIIVMYAKTTGLQGEEGM